MRRVRAIPTCGIRRCMITRLEVDGFKSLRGFAVDLEPFTVLIGPNGAGKSNILEAIGLLHRLAHEEPEVALKGGRGRASDQFSRYRSEAVREISMAVETLKPDSKDDEIWAFRARAEITLSKVAAGVGAESIEWAGAYRPFDRDPDRWLELHPEWSGITQRAGETVELVMAPDFDFIELSDANARDASDRIDSGKLASDGSNLPSVLASLPDSVLGQIRAEVAGLVPGVANFQVVEIDDAYRIEFHMRDGDIVPARLVSGGTLRVLALLTALYSARSFDAVICIEEPENGIYPGRLRRLIDLLREVTVSSAWLAKQAFVPPPQVIVSTHSPVFLAALREHPEHIRYIDTVQRGKYRVTRARTVGTRTSAQQGREMISPAEIAAILESATGSEEDR